MKIFRFNTIVVNILIAITCSYLVVHFAGSNKVDDISEPLVQLSTIREKTSNVHFLKEINNNRSQISRIEEALSGLAENQKAFSEMLERLNFKEVADVSNIAIEEEINSEKLSADEVVDKFDRVYMDETVDETWAYDAESSLSRAVTAAMENTEGMTLNLIECLSSLCKISYELQRESDFDSALTTINHKLEWGAKAYSEYEIDENGQVNVVGFFMREGHDYPESLR